MNLAVALAVFPVIFLGELPDKSMFASLVLATEGRPRQVWLGASAAFAVHVAIATTVGVGVFAMLPRRAVDALVAVLFLLGAAYAWREGTRDAGAVLAPQPPAHTVFTTAFLVIFVAEWGDLTQILTANLAAHYHSPLSVGIGAVAALWAVAAIAVAGGQSLMRWVNVVTIRKITAVVLVVLSGLAAWSALR